MGVRHRNTVPNGTLHVDELEALGVTDATSGPLQALGEWLDRLGVHPSRLAAVRVKHGAVKLLLNVRADETLNAKGEVVTKVVREWRNVPGAEPPPLVRVGSVARRSAAERRPMTDIRDRRYVGEAMTREAYYAELERRGRPLSWPGMQLRHGTTEALLITTDNATTEPYDGADDLYLTDITETTMEESLT